MKVHYPKLYNMAYLYTFNVFTDFKGSNNYILFNASQIRLLDTKLLPYIRQQHGKHSVAGCSEDAFGMLTSLHEILACLCSVSSD